MYYVYTMAGGSLIAKVEMLSTAIEIACEWQDRQGYYPLITDLAESAQDE